jgi:hypothetical protein
MIILTDLPSKETLSAAFAGHAKQTISAAARTVETDRTFMKALFGFFINSSLRCAPVERPPIFFRASVMAENGLRKSRHASNLGSPGAARGSAFAWIVEACEIECFCYGRKANF